MQEIVMDGILALGHFCETHGPCVVLCTQRCKTEPQQFPHSRSVPWCEACQSIDLEQALVSKDSKTCYVTTRTPLQQDLAFLLKQATVRSLSCEEETSKEGGTLYFGDSERGHVLSHTFTLQDSLARGFHRKYSILMLMCDKVHLLNMWPFLVKHIKELARDLQEKAANVNGAEQVHRPQRAVRQAQGSPSSPARSLSQLTGEPAVFAHVHLWFSWMLSCETTIEHPVYGQPLTAKSTPHTLRKLITEMDEECFRKACYCTLTGIGIECDDLEVIKAFCELLPDAWPTSESGEKCKLVKVDDWWTAKWSGCLPSKLPTLQISAEKAFKDHSMPDIALQHYLAGLIVQWLNTARSLIWTPTQDQKLLQALGVQKNDLPLVTYWMSHCNKEKLLV